MDSNVVNRYISNFDSIISSSWAIVIIVLVTMIAMAVIKAKFDDMLEADSKLLEDAHKTDSKANNKKIDDISKKQLKRRMLAAILAVLIEAEVVFLGIFGTGLVDDYAARKAVIRDVYFVQQDLNLHRDALKEALAKYQCGEMDADSLILNAQYEFDLVTLMIESEGTRRFIPPAAISMIYYCKENICKVAQNMNSALFEIQYLELNVEAILHEYDIAIDTLSAVYSFFDDGSRKELESALSQIMERAKTNAIGEKVFSR